MLRRFVIQSFFNFVALWVAAGLLSGIDYDGIGVLIVASLVFSVVNMFIKPLVIFFTLPLVIVTLGLAALSDTSLSEADQRRTTPYAPPHGDGPDYRAVAICRNEISGGRRERQAPAGRPGLPRASARRTPASSSCGPPAPPARPPREGRH